MCQMLSSPLPCSGSQTSPVLQRVIFSPFLLRNPLNQSCRYQLSPCG